MVAGLTAEQGDGLLIGGGTENAVEAGGLAVDERSLRIELPQDFLGAITLSQLKLSSRLRNYFKLDRFCYLDPT